MIPAAQRRIIEHTFELYGKDIKLVSDERYPTNTFFVVGPDEDGMHVAHGSVRYINWARDIQNSIFVPECYDEEASTWA